MQLSTGFSDTLRPRGTYQVDTLPIRPLRGKTGKIRCNQSKMILSLRHELWREELMFWTLSFEMLPDEEIIDDTTRKGHSGIKPAYSVFLTNKRAIFRFDGLGSSLSQSFYYHEIQNVTPTKRLFFTYLELKAKKRNFLLHIDDAPYWAKKILEIKGQAATPEVNRLGTIPSPESRKRELMDMLTILRKNSLLSDTELEEKVQLLDSMKFK
jgi:hypothetical protein